MNMKRKSCPSDVTGAEWEFVLPYLSLMRKDAPQRQYPLLCVAKHVLVPLEVE